MIDCYYAAPFFSHPLLQTVCLAVLIFHSECMCASIIQRDIVVRKTKPSWYVALPNTLEKPWQFHTAITETRNI